MSDSPPNVELDRRRVLVVDDHPDARRSVVDTLSLLGFDAIGCESPREALRQVAAERFDLIITDLMMPGMDGLQFLTELQRRGVATALLLGLADAAIERGSGAWTLEVRVSSKGAQDLYRRFGFSPAGVRARYYENTEDAIVMWCNDIQGDDYRALLDSIRSDAEQRGAS